MLDQDDNFDRIHLSILITYLLDNIYIYTYIYIYIYIYIYEKSCMSITSGSQRVKLTDISGLPSVMTKETISSHEKNYSFTLDNQI